MAIGLATGIIAGVSAATSLAGGAMGASAAGHAADVAAQGQIDAAKISAQSQEKMYNQTRSDQLPYMAGGAAALGRLDYELGLPTLQSSTQAGYKAGYGPQGSAYIPSNGGAPAISATGYAPTFSAANPTPDLSRFGGGSGNPKAAQLSDGGYGGQFFNTPGVKVNAPQQQNPISYTADPSYGSLMHDFSAQDFQTDPGYQFRLSEGQKALDRSAAARGGLFSGETLKANDRYNQGFASNEFTNAYNRFQNNRNTRYNFLSNAAGGGQVATRDVGQAGVQYANNIGNAYMTGYGNAGDARASGYIGAANSWNGALSGVNKALDRI